MYTEKTIIGILIMVLGFLIVSVYQNLFINLATVFIAGFLGGYLISQDKHGK